MNGFIHTALGYLMTGGPQDEVQVTTAGPTALFNSLISLDNVDPRTGTAPPDNTVRSGNLVTIRTRDGIYLTAEHPAGGSGLVLVSAYRGNDTARMGRDVYRIYKVGGSIGDLIGHGDRVRFALVPPLAVPGVLESQWLSTGTPARRAYFFENTLDPLASTVFEFYEERTHLAGFDLSSVAIWPHQRGVITGQVRLSGPTASPMPGGFGLRVAAGGEPLPPRSFGPIPADGSQSPLEIPIDGHNGARSPCDGALPNWVRIESEVRPAEESFSQSVVLRTEVSPHLALRLEPVVVRVKGCLPGILGFLPWPEVRSPIVKGYLERLPGPGAVLAETPPATGVRAATDDPRIIGLALFTDRATIDVSLPLTFGIGPYPPGVRLGGCVTLKVEYTVNDRLYTARFGLRIFDDNDVTVMH